MADTEGSSTSKPYFHFHPPHPPPVVVSLTAGAISGAIAKTTIAPLDRTKINFQVSRTRRYSFKAALKFVRNTYKSDGFFALYRGNSATMARVVPYAGIQFSAHEHFKHILHVDRRGERTPGRRYIAGSLAATTATLFTYPLDTAKARLSVSSRSQYSGVLDVFVKGFKAGGVTGLYRGLLPTLAGVIPYAGASFFTFESLKLFYQEETGKEVPPLLRVCFGATAGLVGQSSSYPLDIVRRRLQTGRVPPGQSVLETLYVIGKNEGIIGGLYKGLSMNWLKGPISVGVSFTCYDYLKPFLKSLMNPD